MPPRVKKWKRGDVITAVGVLVTLLVGIPAWIELRASKTVPTQKAGTQNGLPQSSNRETSATDYSPVNAVNVPTDFKPRETPRQSGCGCGDRVVYFPDAPYTVKANEEFPFRYDASPTWHKQGFDNFHGTVNWGATGAATTSLHDYHPGDYLGVTGTLKVKFSKAGDYNAVVFISADCLDAFYGCRNTCTATGTAEIHVR